MDKYDGLSLVSLALFFFMIWMPDKTYYDLNETYLLARIITLFGFALALFFQGIKENNTPLIVDFICTLIACAYTSLLWGTLSSYTHVDAATTFMENIFLAVTYFGGSSAFYGLGGMVEKTIQSLSTKARGDA